MRPRVARSFEVAGTDPVWLLLDWTTELLAAFEVERLLFREFAVTVHPRGLHGTARGEPYDPAIHTLAHEIKAITQHELAVGAVVGEYLGSARGVGYLILQAEGTFDINTVIAGIVVLTFCALLLDMLVTLTEKRLLTWQPRQGETEKL
ncbi:MAG: hypothetical protein EBX65_10600 [Betaproteobacteria bacterium]|nr:hypothetical protein [Betaproteobacteria bacterium]